MQLCLVSADELCILSGFFPLCRNLSEPVMTYKLHKELVSAASMCQREVGKCWSGLVEMDSFASREKDRFWDNGIFARDG